MKVRLAVGSAILAAVIVPSHPASAAGNFNKQNASNTCWASAVEDVVNAASGKHTSQLEVESKLTGRPENRPASVEEVVSLVASFGLTAFAVPGPGSPEQLYRTLGGGWKVIALAKPSSGLVGHYIVLEGIGPSGGILISDPARGTTDEETSNALYYGWRWIASIVVGQPSVGNDAPLNPYHFSLPPRESAEQEIPAHESAAETPAPPSRSNFEESPPKSVDDASEEVRAIREIKSLAASLATLRSGYSHDGSIATAEKRLANAERHLVRSMDARYDVEDALKVRMMNPASREALNRVLEQYKLADSQRAAGSQ